MACACDFRVASENAVMTTAFYDSPLPPNFTVNDLYAGPPTSGNSLHPAPGGHELYASHVLKVIQDIFADDGFVYAEPLVDLPEDLEPWPINPTIAGPLEREQPGTSVQLNQEDWQRHPLFEGLDALFIDETDLTLTHVFTGSSCALWWEFLFDAGEIVGAVEIRLDGIDFGRGQRVGIVGDEGAALGHHRDELLDRRPRRTGDPGDGRAGDRARTR